MAQEKVAIITGAAGGFGQEISLTLAQEGIKIAAVDINLSNTEQLVENIKRTGGEAESFEADVSSKNSLEKLLENVLKSFSKVDILVNNAGITLAKAATEVTEEEWKKVLDVNLKSVFFASQIVGKKMIEQGGGNIVNISSVNAIVAENNSVVYSVSKTGIVAVTRNLAREWARYNIRVNAVAPGYAHTPLTNFLIEDEKIYQAFLRRIPMRRLCTPRDVAQGVLFLVSDASSYITGHVLVIDGGQTTV
jgi:2-deoxy-D-gluconate 3-dehydrogenase